MGQNNVATCTLVVVVIKLKHVSAGVMADFNNDMATCTLIVVVTVTLALNALVATAALRPEGTPGF